MTTQITLIGLGQIGASIGLALSEQKNLVRRVGHDIEVGVARQAEKMGAIDKVEFTLPGAVNNADLVILALPAHQVRETLGYIAPDLKENAVVMDTAPAKEAIAGWAQELLPPNRHYIGLIPVISPAYLQEHDFGVEAARSDLFHNGMMVIVTPVGASSEAIKLAADLTRLLGASHLFSDPVEIDSLMSATHLLPQLLAVALLNTTVDQPGWREGRKIAGRAYAEAISALRDPAALAGAALINQSNITRVIDGLIASLQTLRNDIQNQNQAALQERLQRAFEGRQTWIGQRQRAQWDVEENPPGSMPTSGEWLSRLVGLGKKKK